MSLEASVMVMKRCPEKGGEYAVLRAIADRANPSGGNVWFKIEHLAFEARMGLENLKLCLKKLIKKGRLLVQRGAAPHGYDLYSINFPERDLSRDHWEQITESKRLEKQRAGKTLRGRKLPGRPRKTKTELAEVTISFPSEARFFGLQIQNFSFSNNYFTFFAKNFTFQSTTFSAVGADILLSNSSFNSLFNSQLYILTGNARTREAEPIVSQATSTPVTDWTVEATPETTPEPVINQMILAPVTVAPTAAPNGALDTNPTTILEPGTNKLISSTEHVFEKIAGAAAGGAALLEELDEDFFDGLNLDDGPSAPSPVDDVLIPPAERAVGLAARPGMPVYDRLQALMGGGNLKPYLPGLLAETHDLHGAPLQRELWLRLTMDEIVSAVAAARSTCQIVRDDGTRPVFRTELIVNLDNLAFGRTRHSLKAAVHEHASPPASLVPIPFAEGQRVRYRGQLGVIVSVAKHDSWQGMVTFELDNGERDSVPRVRYGELQDATDEAQDIPAPSQVSSFDVGQVWRSRDGQVLTVVERNGHQSVRLSDEQVYTLFNLTRLFVHVPSPLA